MPFLRTVSLMALNSQGKMIVSTPNKKNMSTASSCSPDVQYRERSYQHHADRKATDKLHGSSSGGLGVERRIDLGSRGCPSKGKGEKEIDLVKTSRQTVVNEE